MVSVRRGALSRRTSRSLVINQTRIAIMNTDKKRIAIMVGAGFVPGVNAVVKGAALAAEKLGWEMVGIRDGFAGLMQPDYYPDGGLIPLTPQRVDNLDASAGSVLGQSQRIDPFNVRQIDEDQMIEEVDQSDELLERLKAEMIDGLISVVGGQGLSILYKLHRKGLNTVCVPRAIENDIAATAVSFGFNTALSFTIEMLEKSRQAAQASQRIAVVEVLGEQAGWLALQAGIAVCADAILIPEIPGNLQAVAASLKEKMKPGRSYGLVVVAQGAKFVQKSQARTEQSSENPLKAMLSPLATGDNSAHVIQHSGHAAETVATGLQLLIAEETFPLVLGHWARGGVPTAVDRQLGLGYGASAIQGLNADHNGVMVAFVPPDIKFVPLAEAINKVRTVPAGSEFLQIARSLGICLGDE